MKILKIENKKGYFLNKSSHYEEIEKITKEGIFHLIELVIDNDESEIDELSNFEIANIAHKIIYENICLKLTEIRSKRETISSSKNKTFLAAKEKYGEK